MCSCPDESSLAVVQMSRKTLTAFSLSPSLSGAVESLGWLFVLRVLGLFVGRSSWSAVEFDKLAQVVYLPNDALTIHRISD